MSLPHLYTYTMSTNCTCVCVFTHILSLNSQTMVSFFLLLKMMKLFWLKIRPKVAFFYLRPLLVSLKNIPLFICSLIMQITLMTERCFSSHNFIRKLRYLRADRSQTGFTYELCVDPFFRPLSISNGDSSCAHTHGWTLCGNIQWNLFFQKCSFTCPKNGPLFIPRVTFLLFIHTSFHKNEKSWLALSFCYILPSFIPKF